MKAFMLAGTNSGIGKTTISMALMSVFENVSPFKVGPDYIDPGFHEFITENKSYNLDLFMMGEEGVRYSFAKHHKNISIIEGVMGFYDGIDNSLENNSSAHLSRVLNLPVILILDGIGKSTSIAAQVLGYKMLDSRINLAGVIINKVSSEKTYNIFKEAIEKYTGVKCLGYVKKNENLNISSRYLGLLQASEIKDLKEKLEILKEATLENIDLEVIEKIADSEKRGDCVSLSPTLVGATPPNPQKQKSNYNFFGDKKEVLELKIPKNFEKFKNKYLGKKIGVAKDSAFSFYYNDNLEFLEYMGMEIKYFSPIKDKKIPDCDFLYFGGGYPENFAKELSKNKEMILSVKEHYEKNKNIYAECGGFMYLSRAIENLDGESFEMCDLVPCSVVMTNKLNIRRFGYIYLKDEEEKNIARGHEFHYSKIKEVFEEKRIFKAFKKDGRNWECTFNKNKIYAGYPHIHFFESLDLIEKIFE